ncbi:MAG TPA: hypothetical protein VJM33_05740 [Microthrixaceae bacterium]|nr:hypothetical protein [Microthrixaceae bacterium]
MLEERQQAVAEEVRGGLVTGDQQQENDVDELFISERVVVGVAGREQVGDEVIAWTRAAALDEDSEILDDVLDGGVGRVPSWPSQEGIGVEAGGHGGCSVDDVVRFVGGHAHQLADDPGREGIGEPRHEVGSAIDLDSSEKLVGEIGHARFEIDDASCGERADDVPAKPGVVRRVTEEHEPRGAIEEGPFLQALAASTEESAEGSEVEGPRVDVSVVAAEVRVPQGGGDLGMSRQDPHTDGAVVDAVEPAKPAIGRGGVASPAG